MSTQISDLVSACPSALELSAWHDGEKSERLDSHVPVCARCSGAVRSYSAIDLALHQAVAAPAGLADRIKATCRADLEKPPMISWPMGVGRIGVAAAGVLFIGISSIVFFQNRAGETASPAVAQLPTPVIQVATTTRIPVPAVEAVAASAGKRNTTVLAPAPVPVIEFQPLRLSPIERAPFPSTLLNVSFAGDAFGPGAMTPSMSIMKEAASDTVRHVWVVDDADGAVETLRKSLPNQVALNPLTTRGAARVAYRVLLRDSDVQVLVDKLSAAGFSLVSPALPQPGAVRKLLLQEKPVLYEVEFVQGKVSP